jgi:hypothetical protein
MKKADNFNEGKWLVELGFGRGSSFRITTEHGRIVIES